MLRCPLEWWNSCHSITNEPLSQEFPITCCSTSKTELWTPSLPPTCIAVRMACMRRYQTNRMAFRLGLVIIMFPIRTRNHADDFNVDHYWHHKSDKGTCVIKPGAGSKLLIFQKKLQGTPVLWMQSCFPHSYLSPSRTWLSAGIVTTHNRHSFVWCVG